jgi:hypothetical protein
MPDTYTHIHILKKTYLYRANSTNQPQITEALNSSLSSIPHKQARDYITHVIHLHGPGTPRVDKEELASWGIESVKIYGRSRGQGAMIYDAGALTGALETILGHGRGERSRRNTIDDVAVRIFPPRDEAC